MKKIVLLISFLGLFCISNAQIISLKAGADISGSESYGTELARGLFVSADLDYYFTKQVGLRTGVGIMQQKLGNKEMMALEMPLDLLWKPTKSFHVYVGLFNGLAAPSYLGGEPPYYAGVNCGIEAMVRDYRVGISPYYEIGHSYSIGDHGVYGIKGYLAICL